MDWTDFEAATPELAAAGRQLLYARGDGEALLATVRGGRPPRIHPINVGVIDGGLYAFLLRSAKRDDVERDGRFALHSHQDPAAPDEFSVRGRARLIDDMAVRGPIAKRWFFEVDDSYALFAFDITAAVLGRRRADEWPPRYVSWTAPDPTR